VKSRPAQKYLSGAIQLFPLILVVLLIFVGLFFLQTKTGGQNFSLKNAVLSESDSGRNLSDTDSDESDEPEDIDDDEDEVEDEDELEDEDEDEIEDEEEFEVESGTEAAKITTRIRIKSKNNGFQLIENEIEVESNFPLSVDPVTRELKITTPAGERVVAILPQQAIGNMLAGGTFELVLKSRTNPDEEEVEIEEEEGRIVYKITGANQERLLGIFNVLVPRTAIVSAETGQTLGVTQTLLSRLLDLLSV